MTNAEMIEKLTKALQHPGTVGCSDRVKAVIAALSAQAEPAAPLDLERVLNVVQNHYALALRSAPDCVVGDSADFEAAVIEPARQELAARPASAPAAPEAHNPAPGYCQECGLRDSARCWACRQASPHVPLAPALPETE